MKHFTLSIVFLMLLSMPVHAAANKVYVDINGLVCDFCARALEKVFSRQAAVSGIGVDLDTKVITIGLKAGMTLENSIISELVNDAGYSIVNIRHE